MRIPALVLVAVPLFGLSVATIPACHNDEGPPPAVPEKGPAEKTGEKIDRGAEKTKEGADKAADKVDKGAKSAASSVGSAMEKTGKDLNNGK
ncbi:MAG: hypothetical protein NVS3B20_18870 [Polyangiales bacterium]